MKKFKLLSMAIALLFVVPCFSKPIDLYGQWKHNKKSIPIDLPMDASIEEASKELTVNFHTDLGLVYVTVYNEEGDIVHNVAVQTEETSCWTLPLEGLCEEGHLQITDGQNNVYGSFSY